MRDIHIITFSAAVLLRLFLEFLFYFFFLQRNTTYFFLTKKTLRFLHFYFGCINTFCWKMFIKVDDEVF